MMPVDLKERADALEPHLSVLLPTGPGPFPVAVQLHGCGGVQPMQRRYAETARAQGYAAVILDSLAPRRIGKREAQVTICTGLRLRGPERAGDLKAILHWLRVQPWADCGRVALAGWSHGAWTIMETLVDAGRSEVDADLVRAVKTAALYYPYAGFAARTRAAGWGANRPAVYACLGGRDAVVGSEPARRALDRLTADGVEVQLLMLPDATHCFDDDKADDPRTRYRPDLEARAQAFYATALRAGLAEA